MAFIVLIKNMKNKDGFTLIELLVSIFIISLISGLFLANYHSANTSSKLIMATQKLASDIRLAQSYSLGLKEYDGSFPEGGWGIHVGNEENNSYIIFADINQSRTYDSEEEKYKIITLPPGITIYANNTDIIFLPPDPKIYVKGSEYTNAKLNLSGKEVKTGRYSFFHPTKEIIVNFFGMIDINDISTVSHSEG